MAESELDMTPDATAESSFLSPQSGGLVHGSAQHVLEQLADYRESGHSLARVRRDFNLSPRITNRQIGEAAEYGRKLRLVGGDWVRAATQGPPPARVYSLGCPWLKEEP